MKRFLFILLLLLPLAAMSQGELYKRYASRTDLTVAQVSGFKLNENVRVDVVLVVADNDAAMVRLKEMYKVFPTEIAVLEPRRASERETDLHLVLVDDE